MKNFVVALSTGMLLATGLVTSAGALPLAGANLAAERDAGIVQVYGGHDACRWQPGRGYHRHVGPRDRTIGCGGYGYRAFRDGGPNIVLRFGSRDRDRNNFNWRGRDRDDDGRRGRRRDRD